LGQKFKYLNIIAIRWQIYWGNNQKNFIELGENKKKYFIPIPRRLG
jgi:hypothetical protein